MITRSQALLAFFMLLSSIRAFLLSQTRVQPPISLAMSSSSSSSSTPTLPTLAANAKRIFWVRHGEVINPGGPQNKNVYYGAMDVSLSPLGELEAQAAGEYLQQYSLAQVFSSPLKRAVYGGEQVLKLQQQDKQSTKTVIQLSGFTELERGAWCGLTKEEIGLDHLARFDACDESVTPKGGESYRALKQRVLEARDEALSRLRPAEMACVVSHLQVTRCVLSDALGIPIHEMAQLGIATASITCIDYMYNDEDETITPMVHFQSFKPETGLAQSKDGAN